ncbi:MAG TPA: hypothetical protein VK735_18780 [Pseudonocardia sp.]|uniref:hypothetical protein n=1 Tax=Pseudonocardia sp. TaxID=60912 RepID=UPI002CC7A228|nr:hypothetical protein [Pseudonocardia sp.]HTF49493.1 hypothetical protein [Pseudonocardia sp.]
MSLPKGDLLNTVEGVTERISFVITANDHGRHLKPGARRLRAAALADLHEVRARLWRELDLATMTSPAGLSTLAFAASQAAELDDRYVRFWRTEAGAR